MPATKTAIAVVPVAQADPFCLRARRLIVGVLRGRVSLLCTGIFDLLFAYLGVADTQYTIRPEPLSLGTTAVAVSVLFEFTGCCEELMRLVTTFSCVKTEEDGTSVLCFVEDALVLDLGHGLGAAVSLLAPVEFLGDEEKGPLVMVLEQEGPLVMVLAGGVVWSRCTEPPPRSAAVWNQDQVRSLAGRVWAPVGLFDEAAQAKLGRPCCPCAATFTSRDFL